MPAVSVIAFLYAGAFGLLFVPSISGDSHLFSLLLGSNLILLAAALLLWLKKIKQAETWTLVREIKPTHWVQGLMQGSIYFYWGHYYFGVGEYAPLILYQILFANLFHFVFSIYTQKTYKLGFSIMPIILSINLFIWFKPEYFHWQLLMIVAAVLCKAYIVRTVDGKTSHIFNPSGVVLAAASSLILVFQMDNKMQVADVILSYSLVPHFHLFVFTVGCLSQWVGQVSMVPFGAVAVLFAADTLCLRMTGLPLMPFIIHPSVFIGITLLVTDPVTSPKTKAGQFIYGALYGVGIIVTFIVLTRQRLPEYYDKILAVPVLNYLAPAIDRFAGRFAKTKWVSLLNVRWVPSLAYGLFFLAVLPSIEANVFYRKAVFAARRGNVARQIDPRLLERLFNRQSELCREDPSQPFCRQNDKGAQ